MKNYVCIFLLFLRIFDIWDFPLPENNATYDLTVNGYINSFYFYFLQCLVNVECDPEHYWLCSTTTEDQCVELDKVTICLLMSEERCGLSNKRISSAELKKLCKIG